MPRPTTKPRRETPGRSTIPVDARQLASVMMDYLRDIRKLQPYAFIIRWQLYSLWRAIFPPEGVEWYYKHFFSPEGITPDEIIVKAYKHIVRATGQAPLTLSEVCGKEVE